MAPKREKDARDQLNVGMAVEVSLLRAEADIAQARAQVQVRQVELAAAEGRLAEVAGLK